MALAPFLQLNILPPTVTKANEVLGINNRPLDDLRGREEWQPGLPNHLASLILFASRERCLFLIYDTTRRTELFTFLDEKYN